jgi:replicative superfamily II helicase
MKIEINDIIIKELQYMIELHRVHGPSHYLENVEQLASFILASIADGSRRPGSWERNLLIPMNLVADCAEHNCYREEYGQPSVEG